MTDPQNSSPSSPPGAESGAASSGSTVRPGTHPSAPQYQVELPYPEELQAMLGGAYVVESFLGQGGMGAVYRGLQMPLKRPVAVKILAKGAGEDYGFEERFKREAYAMAALTHPNIVQVYDCGDAGKNFLFISMELVEGGDLSDALKSNQITPEVALKLMPQICDGLQAAHERGIIHRDIKPANIFLTAGGRAKVADFGLAKKLDAAGTMVTKTGLGLGTPDYAAPEQYDNLPDIDHRADIYALGVMMYQLLTGSLPRGAWKAPSVRGNVDARFDAVVQKAMEYEREDRYQTVAAFKADILSVAAALTRSGPVQAVPAPHTRTSAVPLATPGSRTGAVPVRPTGAVSPRQTGAVPPVAGRPTGAVPAGRQTGAVPARPQAAAVSRTASTAVPSAPPAAKSGPSTNLIAAIACVVAVLALGAWMFLKKAPGPAGGGNVVQLLDLSDPKGTPLRGIWTSTADGLNGKSDNHPAMPVDDRNPVYELNYIPPHEYDFEVEFTRISGAVSVILSAEKAIFAHQITSGPDDSRPAAAGLTRLDGQATERPGGEATTKILPPPRDGSRHVLVVQVRRGTIRSVLDGKEVVNWTGDFSRLSGAESLRMSREGGLGIGSSGGEIIYHRATVREISGPGLHVSNAHIASTSGDGGECTPAQLREVVEWATAVKGYVTVQQSGIHRKITSMEELEGPGDRIVEVELPGGRAPIDTPPGVVRTLAASSGMKRLAARSCRITPADVKLMLKDKPQLQYLVLESNGLDDSIFESMAQLPQLDTLSLNYNKPITGRGLESLSALGKLVTLSLSDSSLTDAALPAIARIKSLRQVNFNGTKVTDSGMAELRALAQLDDVRIRNTTVTSHGIQSLKSATRLRRIELSLGRGIDDIGEFAALGTVFSNVQELYMEMRGGKEKEAAAQLARLGELASFPALRRIEVWANGSGSAPEIAGLQKLPKLDHLQIDYIFTDDDVERIKGIKSLRILRLPNGRITEVGALKLVGFGNLAEMQKRSFTAAGLKAMKEYRPDVRITE